MEISGSTQELFDDKHFSCNSTTIFGDKPHSKKQHCFWSSSFQCKDIDVKVLANQQKRD